MTGYSMRLAVDSVIKFAVFVFIGIAVITFLFGPPAEILNRVDQLSSQIFLCIQ